MVNDLIARLHTEEPRHDSFLDLVGPVIVIGESKKKTEDVRFLAFKDANDKIRNAAKESGASDVYNLSYEFSEFDDSSVVCECRAEGVMYKKR